MKELTLRHFFEGQISAADLEQDVAGSVKRHIDGNGTLFSQHQITDMPEEFTLIPEHLVQLVDAVRAGELSREALDAATFCLEASDRFDWDGDEPPGDRIPEALFLLGTPEINYPLTDDVLAQIRHYLVTGEMTLTRADRRAQRPVHVTEQVKIFEPGV